MGERRLRRDSSSVEETLRRLRTQKRDAGSAVLTPGYPFTPVAFLVLVVLLLVILGLHRARETVMGIAVVLAGVPVYEVFRRRVTAGKPRERDKGGASAIEDSRTAAEEV